MQMGTLRDFLLARILEEETLAQAAIDAHPEEHPWTMTADADGEHFARWNPWRVLSSCVAKRLILAAHRDVGPGLDRRAEPDRTLKAHACSTCGQYDEYAIDWPCYTLRVLALDWVEHPEYRVEWRPQRLSAGVGRVPEQASLDQTPSHVSQPAAASAPLPEPPTTPLPAASEAHQRVPGPAAKGSSGHSAA
jgi:hypothetical protein